MDSKLLQWQRIHDQRQKGARKLIMWSRKRYNKATNADASSSYYKLMFTLPKNVVCNNVEYHRDKLCFSRCAINQSVVYVN